MSGESAKDSAQVPVKTSAGAVVQRKGISLPSAGVIQMYRPHSSQAQQVFLIADPRNGSKTVAARYTGGGSAMAGTYEFLWHDQLIYVTEDQIQGPVQQSELRPVSSSHSVSHEKEEADSEMEMQEEQQQMPLSFPAHSSAPLLASSSFAAPSHSQAASSQDVNPDVVISGHGAFNEHFLERSGPRRSDPLKATFTVPPGVTIILYAPPGAALENTVANAIESGNYPSADQVELKQSDAAAVLPVPLPYPYVFSAGEEIINYTVSRPDRLNIVGNPVTVGSPTSLLTLVNQHIPASGSVTIHYACCSSAYSDRPAFKAMFNYRGYHLRFKI